MQQQIKVLVKFDLKIRERAKKLHANYACMVGENPKMQILDAIAHLELFQELRLEIINADRMGCTLLKPQAEELSDCDGSIIMLQDMLISNGITSDPIAYMFLDRIETKLENYAIEYRSFVSRQELEFKRWRENYQW